MPVKRRKGRERLPPLRSVSISRQAQENEGTIAEVRRHSEERTRLEAQRGWYNEERPHST